MKKTKKTVKRQTEHFEDELMQSLQALGEKHKLDADDTMHQALFYITLCIASTNGPTAALVSFTDAIKAAYRVKEAMLEKAAGE